MKRFHVHVSVEDIATSVRFYSAMFNATPTVTQSDYAKWMLDDPRINFAISARGHAPGVNHLGFQVETEAERVGLRTQTERAEIAALVQDDAACCYARSNKYWTTDPQGIAWETFHTLGSIPVFGEDGQPADESAGPAGGACCVPTTTATEQPAAANSCCRT